MKPKFTAVGRYFAVYQDGVRASQHTTEREACEKAAGLKIENPNSEVTYNHEYQVEVELEETATAQVQNFDVTVGITA